MGGGWWVVVVAAAGVVVVVVVVGVGGRDEWQHLIFSNGVSCWEQS